MTKKPEHDRVEGLERSRVTAAEVSWALRGVNRASAEVDVSLGQRLHLRALDYTAMGHIMSAGEPLGPLELSHRLGISAGSATELVDRLERAGHVERRRDSEDRRRVSVHPRATTVDRILTELQPLFDSLDDLAETFSPEEQDVIVRYLRGATSRLLDHTRTAATLPPPE